MVKVITIAVLIVGIIIAVFLVVSGNLKLFSQASEGEMIQFPRDVLVTNISDTSFTLVYFTPNEPITTKVSYGVNPEVLEKAVGDDRGSEMRHIHYVTLKDLKPDTQYYVLVQTTDADKLNHNFLEQKTAGKLTGPNLAQIDSFSGEVIGKLDAGFTDDVVFFKTENGQILSTITDNKGKFSFDLSKYRIKDLDDYYLVSKIDEVEFLAIDALDGVADLKTYGYGYKNQIKLPLEMPRIPFYKIELGSGFGGSGQPAAVGENAKSSSGGGNIFETMWIYIKNFFGFK